MAAYHISYHDFRDSAGMFEVFYADQEECDEWDIDFPEEGKHIPGYYWQEVFEARIPETDPAGPFETVEAAIHDARAKGSELC